MEVEEWTPPREVGKVTKKDVQECLKEWGMTLAHFGIHRKPGLHDETTIGYAVGKYGAEWVRLALIGARKEEKSEGYDPARFVSLRTYLDPEKIERYVNQGSGASTPKQTKRDYLEPLYQAPDWMQK